MKTFTGSKYCINYFPLEITSLNCTFQNIKHSSLLFAHIKSELFCFHEFSSKVIFTKLINWGWGQRTEQNWFHTSLRALLFAVENFPHQSKRSTKNRLHNNLGNNLTFLYYFFLNIINFSQIQTNKQKPVGELPKLNFLLQFV